MIPSDKDLSRRLERSEAVAAARFVEARRRQSPNSAAQWIEADGVYAMFDGVASPVTQTFGLGLFTETTAAHLEHLERFFNERGAPVHHEVSPLAGASLADLLCRRGYHPIEFTSVMFKPLLPETDRPDTPNPRIKARLLAEGEEELWSNILAQGWSEQAELQDFLQSHARVVSSIEGAHSFFAHLDGEPVATAVLHCHEGVALLAGASTVPAARNQGAHRALSELRIQTAIAQGCDLAMQCAEPGSTSQRNAERQGFRIAYTRTKWCLA